MNELLLVQEILNRIRRNSDGELLSVLETTGETLNVVLDQTTDSIRVSIDPSSDIYTRIANIEGKYVLASWFSEVTGEDSGRITLPVAGTILTGGFQDGADILVSQITNGQPDGNEVYANGSIVTGSLGGEGNLDYTLSSAAFSGNVAVVYYYLVRLEDYDVDYNLGSYQLVWLKPSDLLGTSGQIGIIDNGDGTLTFYLPNAAEYLRRDGTVPLTASWDLGDGNAIKADQIRARDGDGLRLTDDGNNGIYIKDGGFVGIEVLDPETFLHIGSSVLSSPVMGSSGLGFLVDRTDSASDAYRAVLGLRAYQGKGYLFSGGSSGLEINYFDGSNNTKQFSLTSAGVTYFKGNVGIGVSDASEELEVHAKDAFCEILISSERDDDDENIGRLGFEGLNSAAVETKYSGVKGYIKTATNGAEVGGVIIESRTVASGIVDTLVAVDDKVGIGTPVPGGKLVVRANSSGPSGLSTAAVTFSSETSDDTTDILHLRTLSGTYCAKFRGDRSTYLGGDLEVNGVGDFTSGIKLNGGDTLNVYAFSTFTPTLKFGGAATGITYSAQLGYYCKIGNTVHVTIYLYLTSKGSSAGIATISGLPFTSYNIANLHTAVTVRGNNLTYDGFLQGFIPYNSTYITLNELPETGVLSNLDDTDFSDTSSLMIQATYFTAQ